MENKIINEVDGKTLFNPMNRPDYTWGDKSYRNVEEKRKLWNEEGNGKIIYHDPIVNTNEFEHFYQAFALRPNVIYRGVCEAKHKMLTSLQVYYSLNKKLPLPPREFVNAEIHKLRVANNHLFPRYFRMMDIEDTDFMYLSMMQHYRAKTPFLDFSYSLDSALFFAYDGYKKSWCCSKNNINNYVSLYWIEEPSKHIELVDTIKMLANSLRKAMEGIIDVYAQTPGIDLSIDILKIEQYLMWANPNNAGTGLQDIELGFITENFKEQNINYDYNYVLQQFHADAKAGRIAPNSPAFEAYYSTLYEIIVYKTRLTNLNIIAQDGCFILYNPANHLVPMEEYWVKNPTFLRLPQLHCVDIHKNVVKTCIEPLLKKKGISKETIYPNEEKIVSAIYGDIK